MAPVVLTRRMCVDLLTDVVGCEWSALPFVDTSGTNDPPTMDQVLSVWRAASRESRTGGEFVCRHGAIVLRRDIQSAVGGDPKAAKLLRWQHDRQLRLSTEEGQV